MSKSLRVLIVEDSEDDALLLIRELKKGGYDPEYERVSTAETMRSALRQKSWDVILCDYQMPQFNGLAAITLLKDTGIDIPLIIVSGAIGEERALECMRLGALDYIMKGNMSRLVPAIERELKDAESRRQRKQAEEELRESEEKYRLSFENVADVIYVIDTNLDVLSVSPSVKRILGYKPEDFIGRPVFKLENIFTPESFKQVIADASLILKGETIAAKIYRFIAKDGTIKYGEVSGSPVMRNDKIIGMISVARDVTDRKQAQEDLQASEDRYRSLFENSMDAILLTAPDGRIMVANPEACRIFGRTQEDIYQIGRAGLLDQTDPRLKVALEERKRTGRFRGELTFLRENGTYFSGEISSSIFNDHDGRQMTSMCIRDITERKQSEEKLKDTLESLRKAVATTIQVMVSAVEARDPYTSGHQLRVADIARAIATEMGLSQEKIDGIRMAGSIHDIGKLSIPAEILSKPGKLSAIEFSLIKEHSRKGYEMLKDVESPWPLAQIVYQHHERMDGSGYPRNLKGDEILVEARIMAVADVVESMASHRPYRPSLGIGAALEEIEKNKGILYDDAVADACLRLFREKGFQLLS